MNFGRYGEEPPFPYMQFAAQVLRAIKSRLFPILTVGSVEVVTARAELLKERTMAKLRNIWKTNIRTTFHLKKSNRASYVIFDRLEIRCGVQGALDPMHNHRWHLLFEKSLQTKFSPRERYRYERINCTIFGKRSTKQIINVISILRTPYPRQFDRSK